MKSSHTETGKQGEEEACRYLTTLSYEILHRNWRSGRNEIDIIARDGRTIVFVEVKTRTSENYGFPEEAVSPDKEAHLQAAAEAYLIEKQELAPIRFDIVAIVPGKEPHHIKDAFFPSEW